VGTAWYLARWCRPGHVIVSGAAPGRSNLR